jgi:hypothetical protein
MLEEKSVKKSLALSLALVAVSTWTLAPARADGGWKDAAKNTAMLPVKAASIASGLVVGVPMAVVRRASNRCIENTNAGADHIGGKDSGPPVVIASVLGMPIGLLQGTSEGIYQGTKNAIQYGSSKPFSLESFSLAQDLGGDYSTPGATHKESKNGGSPSANGNKDDSKKSSQ